MLSWRAAVMCPRWSPWRQPALLREHLPEMKVRFVNVVDLFKLVPNSNIATV
jgi:phosphoketolase